jgi:hypothetical protein
MVFNMKYKYRPLSCQMLKHWLYIDIEEFDFVILETLF